MEGDKEEHMMVRQIINAGGEHVDAFFKFEDPIEGGTRAKKFVRYMVRLGGQGTSRQPSPHTPARPVAAAAAIPPGAAPLAPLSLVDVGGWYLSLIHISEPTRPY